MKPAKPSASSNSLKTAIAGLGVFFGATAAALVFVRLAMLFFGVQMSQDTAESAVVGSLLGGSIFGACAAIGYLAGAHNDEMR